MVYIDTNMVRAGVVSHPSMWPFSGYNQIQGPRKKNILIDAVGSRTFVERVRDLLGFRAKGRKVTDDAQGCQLREPSAFYGGLLEIKKRRYGA
jgi:hypothetical protein